MASVLCISGLDPSGHAGLSADMRALGFLGIECLPLVTTLTVQNSKTFSEFLPVPADLLEKQLGAIFEEQVPDAVKMGMLGSADIARTLVNFFDDKKIDIVLDPVFKSTTGFGLVDDELLELYRTELLPISRLVTPNALEAMILCGMKVENPEQAKSACQIIFDMGPGSVLLKGGHFKECRGTDILFDGIEYHELKGIELELNARGTGCTYSSLIAGYLALGMDAPKAVNNAKLALSRLLQGAENSKSRKLDFNHKLSPEENTVWHELNNAISSIISIMPPEYIAEVGNNVAYALESASGPEGICSLDSRLLLKGNKIVTLGRPVFGRQSHVGRVVLAAMASDSSMRCAMNIKYSDENLARIENAQLKIGSFDRTGEPQTSSSMEWGTGKAINDLGYVPDAIFDRGSIGKEPMIRLLAKNPAELLEKLAKLTESGK
ncbi:MAG: bifunctional hydroxymethylpyrimidine kinase/phosphomethylpyrimidine kinase [Thermoplasmata archaeon]|nr:bifunctional hydroxymethylpyrimidine kinase/phosphomethylpyrimidine kinase [Thermoplasmata archaeon]